jgi:peroxiredoxin
LRDNRDRLEKAGLRTLLVGMGTPQKSEAFRQEFDLPFPLVSDPDRKLYRAFDLKRMSTLGFLSPRLARKGIGAMVRGHSMGAPQGDVKQLPGVFIIDPDGRVVFSHYAADPSDHPQIETLLTAAKAAAAK